MLEIRLIGLNYQWMAFHIVAKCFGKKKKTSGKLNLINLN